MSKAYDVIVIGAGHNGLVAAAYLAKSGMKVVIVERRKVLGGAAATEEILPGFWANTGAVEVSAFQPQILSDLNLQGHGLEFIDSPVQVFAPQLEGGALTLWKDVHRSQEEIRRFSQSDAEKYPAFLRSFSRMAGILDSIRTIKAPTIPDYQLGELLPWLKVALRVKRLGNRDMMEFLRVLPLPVSEYMDEWFESGTLKAALGASGVAGSMQGPRGSGTALMLLYQSLGAGANGVRGSRFVRGGTGMLSEALAKSARAAGVEICTGASVVEVTVVDGKATGVVLESGEQLAALAIVSSANPRHTFFDLVGAPQFDVRFVREVKNIRFRGCTARINLALGGLPRFPGDRRADPTAGGAIRLSGQIVLCPDLDYLERAYDDAKYGQPSRQPYLEITIPSVLDPGLAPPGQHIMCITMQYAPYSLAAGDWESQREALGDLVVERLAEYAPDICNLIISRQVLTPLDLEREYGLAEGNIFHGEMGLDQLLFMRPVAGYGQYRTPIENLYLCGAGTHPGGGLSGAPGYNAAGEVIQQMRGW